MSDERWSELVSRRFEWAHRARDRFISELQEPARSTARKASSGLPVVVVYGISQVGKTGLILRLMGIRPSDYDSVDQVLRAGRPKGNSATATAQIYNISPNDDWVIDDPELGRFVPRTSVECRACLEKLREDVNRQARKSYDAVSIAIPRRHFEATLPEKQPYIIDLPGIQSADRSEVLFVDPLLEHWMNLATSVILVAKAESIAGIGELASDRRRFAFIESDRMELVLTFSYSAKTVVDEVPGFQTRQQMFEHVKTNLVKSKLPWITRFYPVEFGVTWETLQQEHPEVHSKVTPWVEETLEEIRQVACERASPVDAIMNLTRSARKLKNEQKAFEEESSARLADLRTVCEESSHGLSKQIRSDLDRYRECQKLEREIDDLKKSRKALQKGWNPWPADCISAKDTEPLSLDRSPSKPKKWIDAEHDRMQQDLRKAVKPGKVPGNVRIRQVAKLVEDELQALLKHKENISWVLTNSGVKKRNKACKEVLAKARKSIRIKLQNQVAGALLTKEHKLTSNLETCRRAFRTYASPGGVRSKEGLHAASVEIPEILKWRESEINRLKLARKRLEQSDDFWKYCRQEFSDEKRERMQALYEPGIEAKERVFRLLEAVLSVATFESLGAWEGK